MGEIVIGRGPINLVPINDGIVHIHGSLVDAGIVYIHRSPINVEIIHVHGSMQIGVQIP